MQSVRALYLLIELKSLHSAPLAPQIGGERILKVPELVDFEDRRDVPPECLYNVSATNA